MGVSGCGKTTVGEALTASTGGVFLDGDHFHSTENVEKMRSGTPLSDEDRQEWLLTLRDLIATHSREQGPTFLACSALKKSYRDILRSGSGDPIFIYLEGSEELIGNRLEARSGHYMPAGLLKSQFAALEPPATAISVDISGDTEAITREILSRIQPLLESPN